MEMNEYQSTAVSTAIYSNPIYPYLGLCGEAGEVAEKMKKIIRDYFDSDDKIDQLARDKEIAKELGDVLWYVANIANDLGFSLQSVAEMNVDKLASRKERGKLQGSGDNR